MSDWGDYLNTLPGYRLHRRWGFWQVQKYVMHDWHEESWCLEKSYIRKAEAVAHLVRLQLEGKKVEWS